MLIELEKEEKDRNERAEIHRFAMLVNPVALAATYPLYGFVGIPLDIQFGWSYIGIDLLGTLIVGAIDGGSGELGLRVMPFGKGLSKLYIVPRIGGGYPVGFMASGEIGYSWILGHFAINLGAGCGWASEVGILPFGNLSLGFAV